MRDHVTDWLHQGAMRAQFGNIPVRYSWTVIKEDSVQK